MEIEQDGTGGFVLRGAVWNHSVPTPAKAGPQDPPDMLAVIQEGVGVGSWSTEELAAGAVLGLLADLLEPEQVENQLYWAWGDHMPSAQRLGLVEHLAARCRALAEHLDKRVEIHGTAEEEREYYRRKGVEL